MQWWRPPRPWWTPIKILLDELEARIMPELEDLQAGYQALKGAITDFTTQSESQFDQLKALLAQPDDAALRAGVEAIVADMAATTQALKDASARDTLPPAAPPAT